MAFFLLNMFGYKKIDIITDNGWKWKSNIITDNLNKITDNNPPKADVAEGNKNIICDKVQENKKTTQDNLWLSIVLFTGLINNLWETT